MSKKNEYNCGFCEWGVSGDAHHDYKDARPCDRCILPEILGILEATYRVRSPE